MIQSRLPIRAAAIVCLVLFLLGLTFSLFVPVHKIPLVRALRTDRVDVDTLLADLETKYHALKAVHREKGGALNWSERKAISHILDATDALLDNLSVWNLLRFLSALEHAGEKTDTLLGVDMDFPAIAPASRELAATRIAIILFGVLLLLIAPLAMTLTAGVLCSPELSIAAGLLALLSHGLLCSWLWLAVCLIAYAALSALCFLHRK